MSLTHAGRNRIRTIGPAPAKGFSGRCLDASSRDALYAGVTLADPVTVTLSRAVDSLREQLVIANARADRAERRVDELHAELAEERRLMAMLTGWLR
jgi:hypothetical protein